MAKAFYLWLSIIATSISLIRALSSEPVNTRNNNKINNKNNNNGIKKNESNRFELPEVQRCNNKQKRSFDEQDFPFEAYYIDPLPKTRKPSEDRARAERLVRGRTYARQDAFTLEHLQDLPNLQDLSSPTRNDNNISFGMRLEVRIFVLLVSFFGFAPLTSTIADLMPAVKELESLSENNFVPGISIVYGTYLSLTLSMLYRRQQEITELCAKETSQLLQLTRRVFHLFRQDGPKRLAVAEYIADQVRILVKGSRGRELMKVIYSDPYEGIESLLHQYRDEMKPGDNSGSLLNVCSDAMSNIVLTRAERLSNESQFLPSAHFTVARVLAFMIVLGYIVATVPIVDENGQVPFASSAFFAVLCAVYSFFSTIAADLNDPFGGVYQIRRSGIASNLLAMKWMIQKDPLLTCEVNFEGEVGHPICWEDEELVEQLRGFGSNILNGGPNGNDEHIDI
eukprot:scaffold7719_cov95-Cylindrotheca_fusiformis.AAC.4